MQRRRVVVAVVVAVTFRQVGGQWAFGAGVTPRTAIGHCMYVGRRYVHETERMPLIHETVAGCQYMSL